ncbi:hypothetical protein [Streptomyces pinistramenti]|uniref:hypothetical protein n=1 Tax=Streptomyces pinistramenti TaxID=2884812 RepID=UPI001D09600C|nr:hypothetical protein [Streptomyces pinistramenti]MCB5908117.1 hypothetical protein [Streptomyces pinistramenti]
MRLLGQTASATSPAGCWRIRICQVNAAGWYPAYPVALRTLTVVQEERRAGKWEAGPRDRAAIRAAGLIGPPAYDYPAPPAPGERGAPSRLQQATWPAGCAGTLRAAADLTTGPLRQALWDVAGLCAPLSPAVDELDGLWARELTLTADEWDLEHVPDLLLRQTQDTRIIVHRPAVTLSVPDQGEGA